MKFTRHVFQKKKKKKKRKRKEKKGRKRKERKMKRKKERKMKRKRLLRLIFKIPVQFITSKISAKCCYYAVVEYFLRTSNLNIIYT